MNQSFKLKDLSKLTAASDFKVLKINQLVLAQLVRIFVDEKCSSLAKGNIPLTKLWLPMYKKDKFLFEELEMSPCCTNSFNLLL